MLKITLNTAREGLQAVLGPLELAIMECIWDEDRPRHTNKQIRLMLSRVGRNVALSTVSTTTFRMESKGLLDKIDHNGVFTYTARYQCEALIEKVIEQVLATLICSWPDILETYVEGLTHVNAAESTDGRVRDLSAKSV